MKILVVSLLRVGDLIMQKPLFMALKNQFPTAEVHLLINEQFKNSTNLFPEVDQFYYFNRDQLQSMMGQSDLSIWRPIHELNGLISKLNSNNYEKVYNFTHTRLSGYICQLVNANQKHGLCANEHGFNKFDSSWLSYFNDRFAENYHQPFHYLEVLANSFNIKLNTSQTLGTNSLGKVFIQPLTSDKKKNWGLINFRKLVDKFYQSNPEIKIKVLGSESEKNQLLEYFSEEEILILSFGDLKRELQQSRMLITLDTSVKHLAAQVGTPILELAIGSSDLFKTSAFANDAYVMHSAVKCAPCAHSSNCRQLSHICSENLAVDDVFSLAKSILENQTYRNNSGVLTKIYKNRFHSLLGWFPLNVMNNDDNVFRAVEKATIGMHLNSQQASELAPVATTAIQIFDFLNLGQDIKGAQDIFAKLQEEQNTLSILTNGIEKVLEESARLCIASNFDQNALTNLRLSLSRVQSLNPRLDFYLRPLTELSAMSFSTPFHFFGSVRKKLEELNRVLNIRKKIIQCLSQLGGEHGTRNTKLLERSIEKT